MSAESPSPSPENDLVGFLLSEPVRRLLGVVDGIESRLDRTIRHVQECLCGKRIDPRCEAQSKPVTADPVPDEQ